MYISVHIRNVENLPAKGLEQLLQTVKKVCKQINPKLAIDGIIITMVDARMNFAKEISSLLRDTYRQQKIDIYFNFIGNYFPPTETITEEERLAAIDADIRRKQQEKAKRIAERQKQRNAELRARVEEGDPEAIAAYEKRLEQGRKNGANYRQELRKAREATPEYMEQLEEKERLKREKMLENERKRAERTLQRQKLSRAELKEKAKTDPDAIRRYEATLTMRRESYYKKKGETEEALAVNT